MEVVKRSVVARGCGEGRMNKESTEDFQGSEDTLCDTVMLDICHYTLVKTHRMCNI